jgi:imidazoleglycerol-phosphate dehydratase
MPKSRRAKVERNTKETRIEVDVNLDGEGRADLATGVPFLDHMLDQVARHGMIDLVVRAQGDLHIDAHHTVEDIGITLGQAVAKRWATRRASCATATPTFRSTRRCRASSSIFPGARGSNSTCPSPAR